MTYGAAETRSRGDQMAMFETMREWLVLFESLPCLRVSAANVRVGAVE